jgi:hypothetical protein
LSELKVPKGKLVQNNQDQDPCWSLEMSRSERQKLIKKFAWSGDAEKLSSNDSSEKKRRQILQTWPK